MKNKIAIASAFLAASSFSMGEIVINDFLSFEGFVDSSYSHTDIDTKGNLTVPQRTALGLESDGSDDGDASSNSFAVDQVEISWLFDFDTVTAQIDLQYEGDSNDGNYLEDGELVEQAFVNFALANGDVVTAGRYASMLGFEAFEPTGLYQSSTAYLASGLPGYAQGVKYTRESDTSFFGISIQDEAFDNGADSLGGYGSFDPNGPDGSYAVELAYSQDLGNGIGVFLGGAYEDGDSLGDTYIINAYATYETGAWLFAAEANFGNSENNSFAFPIEGFEFPIVGDDVDCSSFLLMANYTYSDTASVTARVSCEEIDSGDHSEKEVEGTKFTLAHNKALADNLALIVEVSSSEYEIDGFDVDVVELAVELLFTF